MIRGFLKRGNEFFIFIFKTLRLNCLSFFLLQRDSLSQLTITLNEGWISLRLPDKGLSGPMLLISYCYSNQNDTLPVPPPIKFRPILVCFRHFGSFWWNPADIQDSAGTCSIAQDEPHCLSEKKKRKRKRKRRWRWRWWWWRWD